MFSLLTVPSAYHHPVLEQATSTPTAIMATIQRRATKNGKSHYRVIVRLRGHPCTTATFHRKTDAKRWAQQVETAIREGRYFKTREAKRRTLAELIDRYIEHVVAMRPKGRKKLRYLLGRWRKELGDYLIADVTSTRIAEVRDRLRHEVTKRGSKRAPATVNRYLGALSHAFTIATREWGWAELNPLSNVQRLTEPRGRVRWLDKNERERLLVSCKASWDDRLYPLVLLGISTGAREGELMALRWRDLDLTRGVGVLHDTKNGDRRSIAITGVALEVMRERHRGRSLDTDIVFAGPRKGAWFPLRPWKAALRDAQIADFTFHDLRHTAASYLAMSGATTAEIAEVLGHKTLAMVKRYSHLADSHTHSVVARMNEKYLSEGLP